MDWNKAIEINRAALVRIVAALVAMVGVGEGGARPGLSVGFCRAMARLLRPAESAVRRLIVMAARGLVLKPGLVRPVRPMPQGLVFAGRRSGRVSFQLFDPRMVFSFGQASVRIARVGPSIRFFDVSPLVPLFQRPVPETPSPLPQGRLDEAAGALRLGRRLAAVKGALEDLPRQARRLLRWQIKRDKLQVPAFKSALRPGPPPGHRKKPKEEIDFVLRECHALARDALRQDTS